MASTDKPTTTGRSRADDHARKVADALIAQIEAGTAPWQRGWEAGERHAPYNASTGRPYRGGNSVYLWATAHERGYGDPRWLTYRQAAAMGAQVRKGEKGTAIEYWMREDRKTLKDANGKPILDANGNRQDVVTKLDRPRVFHASVFNAAQIDGLPPLVPTERQHEWERAERVEALLRNSGAQIRHVNGDGAYYQPSTDTITLPERGQFRSQDAYYATALHELAHWTGHPDRLGREGSGGEAVDRHFGSEAYAREELRAEIAALMTSDELGVGHQPEQSAAYVQSWVRALKEDPREIFRAARDAEAAKDYVMQYDPERVHEHEQQQARTQQQGVHAEPVSAPKPERPTARPQPEPVPVAAHQPRPIQLDDGPEMGM